MLGHLSTIADCEREGRKAFIMLQIVASAKNGLCSCLGLVHDDIIINCNIKNLLSISTFWMVCVLHSGAFCWNTVFTPAVSWPYWIHLHPALAVHLLSAHTNNCHEPAPMCNQQLVSA